MRYERLNLHNHQRHSAVDWGTQCASMEQHPSWLIGRTRVGSGFRAGGRFLGVNALSNSAVWCVQNECAKKEAVNRRSRGGCQWDVRSGVPSHQSDSARIRPKAVDTSPPRRRKKENIQRRVFSTFNDARSCKVTLQLQALLRSRRSPCTCLYCNKN